MSIQFEKPVDDKTLETLRELFGEATAHDRQTFLYDKMRTLHRPGMSKLANEAKQAVRVGIHGEGEIKTLSDGTQYRVTPEGWRKVVG